MKKGSFSASWFDNKFIRHVIEGYLSLSKIKKELRKRDVCGSACIVHKKQGKKSDIYYYKPRQNHRTKNKSK